MINLIIKTNPYTNEDAIENVINYIFSSEYIDDTFSGGFGVLSLDVESIINSFYLIRNGFHKLSGQMIHHIILTFHNKKISLDEIRFISQVMSNHIGQEFQNVYAVHTGSNNNYDNIHVHFAINSVSHINGNKLSATNSYYGKIINCILSATDYTYKVNMIHKS